MRDAQDSADDDRAGIAEAVSEQLPEELVLQRLRSGSPIVVARAKDFRPGPTLPEGLAHSVIRGEWEWRAAACGQACSIGNHTHTGAIPPVSASQQGLLARRAHQEPIRLRAPL